MPPHPLHDYLVELYLKPLSQYYKDQGMDVSACTDLDNAKGTVVLDTDYLDEVTTAKLKNNGCKIVGMNLVDSSMIAQPLREHIEDADLIFTISGVQTTNTGHELEFDDQFQPVLAERQFLPETHWLKYNMMRLTGRLLSLPYVHWDAQPEPGHLPYEQKNGKVLVRGGAHFRRVVLSFFLMRAGLLDENSGYALRDFFGSRMNPQFQYCEECRGRFIHKSRYDYHVSQRPDGCNSPANWGAELDLTNCGHWNNRCPRSWYWLADQFQQHHGPISPALVESMFNQSFVTTADHQNMLRRSSFTADLKWIFSIYAAQRFWDAAICGTVNLLPYRSADQEYFPNIYPGQHYSIFHEKMGDLECGVFTPNYRDIVNNCWALYTEWIRPTNYRLNTNLLRHIAERVMGVN